MKAPQVPNAPPLHKSFTYGWSRNLPTNPALDALIARLRAAFNHEIKKP